MSFYKDMALQNNTKTKCSQNEVSLENASVFLIPSVFTVIDRAKKKGGGGGYLNETFQNLLWLEIVL